MYLSSYLIQQRNYFEEIVSHEEFKEKAAGESCVKNDGVVTKVSTVSYLSARTESS